MYAGNSTVCTVQYMYTCVYVHVHAIHVVYTVAAKNFVPFLLIVIDLNKRERERSEKTRKNNRKLLYCVFIPSVCML